MNNLLICLVFLLVSSQVLCNEESGDANKQIISSYFTDAQNQLVTLLQESNVYIQKAEKYIDQNLVMAYKDILNYFTEVLGFLKDAWKVIETLILRATDASQQFINRFYFKLIQKT